MVGLNLNVFNKLFYKLAELSWGERKFPKSTKKSWKNSNNLETKVTIGNINAYHSLRPSTFENFFLSFSTKKKT